MTNLFFSFFLTIIFSSCANHDNHNIVDTLSYNHQEKNIDLDMDFIDVYKLTIGKTFLYGNFDDFINDMGIPNKLTITKNEFEIKSKADLGKVIASAKEPDIVTLHYPGIDMWFAYDNYIIPSSIDFRKTGKSVTYGQTKFDITYTIQQFKKEFPISAKSSFKLPQSLFEIATKEKGANFEHFLLMRKSKDDPSATSMVEFTFEKGKLVFILFANF